MRSIVMFLILLVCIHNFVCAEGLVFEHFTTVKGLPNNGVAAISQDEDGFIWVGTYDGVARFDGNEFKSYYHVVGNNKTIISSMGEDLMCKGRYVYVVTDEGLSRINRLSGEIINGKIPLNHLPSGGNNRFYNGIITKDGSVWALTDRCVAKFDLDLHLKKVYYADSTKPGNPQFTKNTLSHIQEDSKGNIWFGGSDGLNCFDIKKGVFYNYLNNPEKLPFFFRKPVKDFLFGKDDKLWIGVRFEGLFQYDFKSKKLNQHYLNNDKDPNVNMPMNIVQTADGCLWMGAYYNGLLCFNPKNNKWISYMSDPSDPNSLCDNFTQEVFLDREGCIWIGTEKGLDKISFKKPLFNNFKIPSPAKYGTLTLRSMAYTSDGSLWFNTFGQNLWRYTPVNGKWKEYRHPDNPDGMKTPHNHFGSLLEDKLGRIWASTKAGLLLYDKKKDAFQKQIFPKEVDFLSNEHVLFITYDSVNTIWASTPDHGLVKISSDLKKASILDLDKGEPIPISGGTTVVDKKGNLWIGLLNGNGMAFVPKGTSNLIRVNPKDYKGGDLLSNYIFSISTTEYDNRIWIITGSSGIVVLDPDKKTVKLIGRKDGLPTDAPSCLLFTSKDTLWISSANGLTRYVECSGKVKVFDWKDGIPDNDLSGDIVYDPISKMAYFSSASGNIINASLNNLNIKNKPPKVIVSSFSVNGKYLEWQKGQNLKLDHNENFITISHAALKFANAEKTWFRYRLTGLNDKWSVPVDEQTISFANLSPGQYTYEVQASNNEREWYPQGASLSFFIATPWWETWWFRLIVGSSLIGGLYLFYKYRLEQALRLERIRSHIARDLHDDMGATLSTINILSQVAGGQLSTDVEKSRRMLKTINTSAQKMLDSMDDIVWSINPANDKIDKVAIRMKLLATELLESRDIDFHLELPDNFDKISLNMERRRDLYLIYKEALNNISKYAQATEVKVSIKVSGNTLTLSIKDNGIGMNKEKFRIGGNGLTNMRNRAEESGGNLKINSVENEGTEIILEIPTT